MSPALKRRILLVSLVAICAANVACSELQVFSRYQWEPDPTAPKCESMTWKQVSRERARGLCGTSKQTAADGVSCALGCLVVSPYSEAQAQSIYLDGISLWEHEAVMHGMKGLKHQ